MNSDENSKTPATINEPTKQRFPLKSQTEEELLKNGEKSINSIEKNHLEPPEENKQEHDVDKVDNQVNSNSNRVLIESNSIIKQKRETINSENIQDLHKSAMENSQTIKNKGREYGLVNGDNAKEKSAEVTVDYQNLSLDSIENQPRIQFIPDDVDREDLDFSVNCSTEVKNSSFNGLETEPKKYDEELDASSYIPKTFKDFLEVSDYVKNRYVEIRNKNKIIDCLLCLTGMITIVLSLQENFQIITYYNLFEGEYTLKPSNNIMRLIVIGNNCISAILLLIRYFNLLEVHKIRNGSITNKDTLVSTRLLTPLIIEIVLNLFFVPPYVNHHFIMNGSIFVNYDYTQNIFNSNYLVNNKLNSTNSTNITNSTNSTTVSQQTPPLYYEQASVKIYYNISTILTFFILFRVYHFFRLVHTFSFWSTPKAHSTCKLMNTKANVSFAIKAYLKINPFISLLFCVAFVVIIFGYAAQLFEYYNSTIMNSMEATDNIYVQVMLKFSNIYNALWLIVVTMSTIGYGDIFPTTYFGRVIAILACIIGTFILSLLVVFLNTYINFDEVEQVVFNTVIEEKSNPIYLKKEACSLVGTVLRYNFLRKRHPENTTRYRLYLWIEMKYNSKKFKTNRISAKKVEADIDGVLNNLTYQIDHGLSPFKNALEVYHKTRLLHDNTIENLTDSNQVTDKFLKNSIQMWNLLKILNKDKTMEGLNSIDDVFDSQVNAMEEILYYHMYRERYNNKESNHSQLHLAETINASRISQSNDEEAPQIISNKILPNRGNEATPR